MYDQCGRIGHCPFLDIDTRTAAPVFHPTAHTHPSFRTERADFFFPLRSCEVVGLCREKSLFLAGARAVIPKEAFGWPILDGFALPAYYGGTLAGGTWVYNLYRQAYDPLEF